MLHTEKEDEIIGEGDNVEKKLTDEQMSVTEDKPSILKKIHDALQEWSNDDQRDQEIDDTRP